MKLIRLEFDRDGRGGWFRSSLSEHHFGAYYVAECKDGMRIGKVEAICQVSDLKKVRKMPAILGEASREDLGKIEKNSTRREQAFSVCCNCIEKHRLPMRLVDVEAHILEKKITFYFTSQERVDFRALIKDLARVFKCRIELKQIGLREKWKRLGDFGHCGRPLCCRSFLKTFEPVTTKMAKEQGLPLDSTKITGMCGKLRCCLRYELAYYREEGKRR